MQPLSYKERYNAIEMPPYHYANITEAYIRCSNTSTAQDVEAAEE